jgi:signal transduction histidine kinase
MSGNVLLVTQKNAEELSALRDALREDGYSLWIAADTATALQKARQDPPIAVILDADIQTDADLTLCQWLRTDPTTVAVKLLVTARSNTQRLAALEVGVDEFLTSPLDWAEVRTRLRTMQVGQSRRPSLEDFLSFTPDLVLGANPVDILGNADLLSHDLKNPVGIITSSLELLREFIQDRLDAGEPNVERELRLVENTLAASHRLLFLINDMIDLAKLEVDAFPITPQALDMAALTRDILAENAPAIAAKGISVTFEAPADLPPASGDHSLIRRICNVLLDNTLKFSQTGDHALLSLQADGTHVTLHLTDHGRPILPEHRDSIFERAVQWEAREQGGRTSVAMGLPFARAAARRMDGDVLASSNPADATTTFTLRLPRATRSATG